MDRTVQVCDEQDPDSLFRTRSRGCELNWEGSVVVLRMRLPKRRSWRSRKGSASLGPTPLSRVNSGPMPPASLSCSLLCLEPDTQRTTIAARNDRGADQRTATWCTIFKRNV